MTPVSKRVFISYRRDDTASAAGRLYDRMSQVLGKTNVFFDVSTIGGGADFIREIATQIGASNVALIFIGDKWMGMAQSTGKGRLWDSNDHVRAEVHAALCRSMLVLPILVGGARMPKLEELPEDIGAITTRNALPLRHESFDDDVENIVTAVLGKSARKRAWENKSTLPSKIAYGVGGALAASTCMLIIAILHFWMLERPISASIGGPLTTLVLIAGLVFGAWLGVSYEVRKRNNL